MRSLGAVAMPVWIAGEPFSDLSRRCDEYGRALAAEHVKEGRLPDLTLLQADIDACKERLAFKRSLLQFTIFSVGLGVAGYAGFWLWKNKG